MTAATKKEMLRQLNRLEAVQRMTRIERMSRDGRPPSEAELNEKVGVVLTEAGRALAEVLARKFGAGGAVPAGLSVRPSTWAPLEDQAEAEALLGRRLLSVSS